MIWGGHIFPDADHLMTKAMSQNKSGPAGLRQAPDFVQFSTGAGEAIRTPDPHLGKVMLYP